jgi:Flp pilus assembly protein TadG
MALKPLKAVTATFARFVGSRAGSITPLFAIIGAFALFPAVAMGVDVARGMSNRNNLQDALDGAALAVAHLPVNSSQATINTTAQAWLNANTRNTSLGPVTLTTTMGTQQVDLTATSTITTMLGPLGSFTGLSQIPVSAHSTVKWGLNHIELALVLDNTGSMAQDNKLSSLQSAASSLVDALSASATQSGDPNALKIGVVPFSMTVNIGSTYKSATWMSGAMPSQYGSDVFSTPATNRFALLATMGMSWGGCVESRPMPYDVQDTAPSLSNPATLFVPFFAPDEPDANTIQYSTYGGSYTYSNGRYYYSFLNNYLNDGTASNNFSTRQARAAKYVTAGLVNGANGYWGGTAGPNAGCQTASLQRLTTSTSTIKAKLNQMVAAGDTEIPLGLMWGWHVLSPNAPFADGAAYGAANTIKIAVLVTDGQNTYQTGFNGNNNSAYTALGYVWQNRIATNAGDYSNPAAALDDRLTQLCSNMKAQNIVIYTVPVEVTDTGIKSLLQNCASGADKYIDVSSSSQLQAAFSNIAGSISALRISS